MSEYKKLHKTSKDYTRLFELLRKGYEIICYVDYNFVGSTSKPCRDICRARMSGNRFSFGARGIEYGCYRRQSAKDKNLFFEDCRRMNLEFIDG
jgi:hypothetical protein